MRSLVVRTIATGVGHCEGPVIRADGEVVVVSMDQGRLYKIAGGRTAVLAEPGFFPNGATEGADGTIYVTQGGGRMVDGKMRSASDGTGGIQTVSRDGKVGWLTQDPIAPNDLCFGPDGWLYVTDPTRNRPGRDDGRLFRCNVETGEAQLICSVPWFPNGIGFGLDDALYVARVGESQIMRFELEGEKLGKGEVYCRMVPSHRPDGFAFDVEGNLIVGCNANAGDNQDTGQVQTFDRNGKLVDTFVPGSNKLYTNVALDANRRLVITDTHGGAVLEVEGWPHPGLPLHPFRRRPA